MALTKPRRVINKAFEFFVLQRGQFKASFSVAGEDKFLSSWLGPAIYGEEEVAAEFCDQGLPMVLLLS